MYNIDREFVCELYMAGFSINSISELLGVHRRVIRRGFKVLPSVPKIKNTESLFWSKVNKTEGGCWEWIGRVNNKGYGQFRLNGRLWFVHRLSYTLIKGEIPSRMFIIHKCDNPVCCNPNHLLIGDQSDNMIDMVLKGRRRNQVLDSEKVKSIKSLSKSLTPSKIASRLSLPVHAVKKVVYGENWVHVK